MNTEGETETVANVIIQAAVVSHKGRVRSNNEDNFCLDGIYMQCDQADDGTFMTISCRDEYQLYAVCDGMGGTEGGEEASLCAVRVLSEEKNNRQMTDAACLRKALCRISQEVYSDAVNRGQRSGTTIALVLITGDAFLAANVGDSRIYRFRKGVLSQISVDHSQVYRMVAMGLLTPEQARSDPNRHIISQYLGMPEEPGISPHIEPSGRLFSNDAFLVCSDGLTDMVEDRQIERIFREGEDPGDTADALVKAALDNGGRDNVTVMVLKVMQMMTFDHR